MVTTEKADVYSFGVVVLEILFGKHPGDFLSSFSSESVNMNTEILLKDVLDDRLPLPVNRLASLGVVLAATVGLACIHPNPKSRPTMKCVVQQFVVPRREFTVPLQSITLLQLLSSGYFS